MILNIYGKSENGSEVFSMPNIILDRRLHYKVSVIRVYFSVDGRDTLKDPLSTHDLLLVSSNLVDRSAENPHQAIVYFDYNRKNKQVQSFCAQHIIFQPLQLYELANASFQIRRVNGEPVSANFNSIFFQLEIKRSDTYGWL